MRSFIFHFRISFPHFTLKILKCIYPDLNNINILIIAFNIKSILIISLFIKYFQFPKQPNVASERINITFRKMYMIEGLTV